MSLQTKIENLRGVGGQQSKIANLAGNFIPSGVSAQEAVNVSSSDYTAPGVQDGVFSMYIGTGGNITVEDINGAQATWKVADGFLLLGSFVKIVSATTTASDIIAFV